MTVIEEKPLVERLGYIGGQDEELGGYCEPLIIRKDGREHYVLHEMHTYREIVKPPRENDWLGAEHGETRSKHSKVEFETLDKLVEAFRTVIRRLGIDSSLPWIETDAKCGYDLPDDALRNAALRDMFK